MSTDPVLTNLGHSDLFQGLSPDKLELILRRGQTATISPGELLIQEGQPNTELFVVIRGEVGVFLPQTNERLTTVRLAKIGAGGCIGEYSFIDNDAASASVAANEQTEVFKISQADFERTIESDNAIGHIVYRNLLRLLVTRLREENRALDLVRVIPLQGGAGRPRT